MIKETKNYTDDDGKSVTAHVPINIIEQSENGDSWEEYIDYEGTVGIRTPMGIQPIHFPFPKGFKLEQCFESFEDIADEEIKRMQKEAQEKQKEDNLIITPGQVAQHGATIPFPKR